MPNANAVASAAAPASELFPKNMPMARDASSVEALSESVISPDVSAFRESLQQASQQSKTYAPFDGGAKASFYENRMRQEMEALNTGAMSKIVDLDIDKEFKFLTDILIEEYKDPDPSEKKDHSESTRTIVALIGAGNQAKSTKLVEEQNALMGQQMRLITEGRIGRKVQYQDTFLEVRPEDTHSTIFYRLGAKAQEGSMEILNHEGKTVVELALSHLDKGDHKMDWNLKNAAGEPVPPGMYFVRFDAKDKDHDPIPHIMEMEGVISRVDTSESGKPVYYVGDMKIDGRVTRVGSLASDWEVASMRTMLNRLQNDIGSLTERAHGDGGGGAITPPAVELAEAAVAREEA